VVASLAREAGEMGGGEEVEQPEAVSQEASSATTRTARRQESREAAAGAAEAADRPLADVVVEFSGSKSGTLSIKNSFFHV